MLRLAFGRPWRQTEGMLGSIMDLLGLDLAVPGHTTFSRRSVDLGIATALTGSLQESDRYVRQIGTDTNASHAASNDCLFLSSRSSPGPGRSAVSQA
jgi:hypothetical protein